MYGYVRVLVNSYEKYERSEWIEPILNTVSGGSAAHSSGSDNSIIEMGASAQEAVASSSDMMHLNMHIAVLEDH